MINSTQVTTLWKTEYGKYGTGHNPRPCDRYNPVAWTSPELVNAAADIDAAMANEAAASDLHRISMVLFWAVIWFHVK